MKNLFDITKKVIVITGGCGVLASAIARYLAEQGARIAILARKEDQGRALEAELNAIGQEAGTGGQGLFVQGDVLDEPSLIRCRQQVIDKWGTVDVLINAAGGNMPGATIAPGKTFLDIESEDFRRVVDLNLTGTMLPTKVFGEVFAQKKEGNIVNFSSASALRPLTRVVGYGSAKAAVANYTKYMATEFAVKFSPRIRVNAIVPGFLITNQNRTLLTNPDGSYTDRGRTIIAHTPAGRFSTPDELFGTIHYLISEASSFVTGTQAIVDGGFDAFCI